MTLFLYKLDRRNALNLAVTAVLGLSAPLIYAGAKTDGSVGAVQTLSGNFTIPQTLGTIKGGNLFHSFQNFGVNSGESATFTTTSALQNVISRVTGGTVSAINGLLKLDAAAGSAPNFFFINPAGVTFGAGASVDVPGAFHVSTANYLKFADGSSFHADLNKSSSFSSAAPEAFGFLGTTRASVTVKDGATLSTQPMQPISIVAGDIEINNASVSAQGGDIRMAAVGQASQEVPFKGDLPAAFGKLDILDGGYVYAYSSAAYDGGSTKISAGDITLDGRGATITTGIFSEADGSGNAGSVDLKASGKLSIMDGSQISSMTLSAGAAGSVKAAAASILIDGNGKTTGIFSQGEAGSTGNAGDVEVGATGKLSLVNGGIINSSTFAAGNAGSVTVSADSITVDQGALGSTGIFSQAEDGSAGNSGVVKVSAKGSLSVTNGGQISSSTFSSGKASLVKIDAADVTIDGQGLTTTSTGVFSNANQGSGDAGNVQVNAGGNLFLKNGGVISSSTFTSGNAGLVTVNATGAVSITNGGRISSNTSSAGSAGAVTVKGNSISIDQGVDLFTGIFSDAKKGTGNAGIVTVEALGNLSIANGGEISSSTSTSGNAGLVKVSAAGLMIDQGDAVATGIFSTADAGSGNAGNVEVKTSGSLSIGKGGQISSSTGTSGKAGLVAINAGSITIDGQGNRTTGIFSNANRGTGDAGNVEVAAAGNVSLKNGGKISSSTTTSGNAGLVKVGADSITIDQGDAVFTGIFSEAKNGAGNAGNVEINTTGKLSIASGGEISSSTYSTGAAGNVKVDAGSITIDKGTVSITGIFSQANAGSGNAGNVTVAAIGGLSIANGGQISSSTSTSGNAGLVKVGAGSITIDQGDAFFTGIFSDTKKGAGNAGNVTVEAVGKLSIASGGQISSSTSTAGNAGLVNVTAGSISIDHGSLSNTGIFSKANAGTGNAGNVTVAAVGGLSIANGGVVSSSTNTSGKAGLVKIDVGNITIDGQGLITGIFSNANRGTGGAGNVEVNSAGNLTLVNGGEISSSTSTSGNAGLVKVAAGSIAIDQGTAAGTGIFSTSNGGAGNAGSVEVRVSDSLSIANSGQISSSTSTSGAGGLVTVTAHGGMSIANGGQISSNTSSLGNAGSVIVKGDSITIDQGSTKATGIFSQAVASNAGNGGNVEVTAIRNISIMNGGVISSSTFAKGRAGSLKINADSITIDGQDLSTKGTGIFSNANQGTGDAGNVEVNTTGNLSLKNGGLISSSTHTSGNAGLVKVAAGSLTIDQGFITGTGIFTTADAGTGNAGSVEVTAGGNLLLTNGGQISSSTSSSGKAGSVTVNAAAMALSGNSSISSGANSGSSGQTGNVSINAAESVTLTDSKLTIQNKATVSDAAAKLVAPTTLTVTAPRITLENAQITASSTGNLAASNIVINDTDRLVVRDASSITTSAVTGKGGSIAIQGGGVLLLDHSRITTSVTGVDNGDGGPITINAPILALNTGFIQANTAVPGANGGDVNINVDAAESFIISSGHSLVTGGAPLRFDSSRFAYNVIQAARPDGVNGTIHISSPQIDLAGTLASLSTQLIDFGNLGMDLCQIGTGSSLTPLGRGGLPPTSSGLVRP